MNEQERARARAVMMRQKLEQRMAKGRNQTNGVRGIPMGDAEGMPGASPYNLEKNLLNSRLGNLMPGNVGDINKIIWPFFFTVRPAELAPNTMSQSSFTVSQEAAFIAMSFSKVVFLRGGSSPNWTYTAINPNDETAAGDANGLNVQFRDAQSSRVFQKNPMPLDSFGIPEFPTALDTPIMFLPNSTVEVLYSNTDATNVYVPFITFFGYRVRIENAQEILSLVTG